MEGYPWIKLYRDIGDDSKMKRLTSDEFMLWIIMMTKVDSDGFLFLAEGVPYNSEDLSLSCNNFRKSIDDGISIVETALKKFASMKMISIGEDGLVCLLNFKARQEKNLTEAERQAKSRENKKNQKQDEPCHTDVTPMSHDSVTHVTEVSQESHPKIEDIRLKNKELENTKIQCSPKKIENDPHLSAIADDPPDIFVLQTNQKEKLTELSRLWNEVCKNHPKVVAMSSDRKRKEQLRLKEQPDFTWWKGVFEKVRDTEFLNGKNPRGWKASFDFVIENASNSIKIFEGAYGGNQRAGPETLEEQIQSFKKYQEEKAYAN